MTTDYISQAVVPTDDSFSCSIAELWSRFCINERYVPRMLDMPKSSWDLLKRASSPRIFGLGKRRYILVADLKVWLEEIAERWEGNTR